MPRLLAILLAAAPFAAGAQTTTPLSGQILFDGAAAPVVNRAECQGTGTIGLTWKAAEQTVGAFVTGTGTFSVYAKATDKTDVFPFCTVVDLTDTPVATVATPTSLTVENPVQVSVSALVAAAGYDCTTADKTIYVCVLWTDDATPTRAVKAYAKGSVSLKVLAPTGREGFARSGVSRLRVPLSPAMRTTNGGVSVAVMVGEVPAVVGG